jgi:dephospho-CoA kinase
VWVDANPKLRYQRIYSRQRSSEDKKTFEQFLAEEQAEMDHHGGDDATLNMAGVKAKADIFITNDSDDVETFKKTAQKALGL